MRIWIHESVPPTYLAAQWMREPEEGAAVVFLLRVGGRGLLGRVEVGSQEAHAPLGLLPAAASAAGEGRRSGLESQPAVNGKTPLTTTHQYGTQIYLAVC
jgi:hypothetical protein